MTAAIAMFAFGAVTALLSLQYPVGSLRMPGSGLLPLVLGVMLMGLAAARFAQVYAARPKPAEAGQEEPAKGSSDGHRVLFFMGTVAAATALLGPLGFLPVSFLLILILLRIMGEHRWMVCGLIALASAAASQLVFVIWLKIPLPSGLLGF